MLRLLKLCQMTGFACLMVKASLPLPCWVRSFLMVIIRRYFLSFSNVCSVCNFCTCSKVKSVLRPLWARYASSCFGQTTDQGPANVSEVLYLHKNAILSVIPSIQHSKSVLQHIQWFRKFRLSGTSELGKVLLLPDAFGPIPLHYRSEALADCTLYSAMRKCALHKQAVTVQVPWTWTAVL